MNIDVANEILTVIEEFSEPITHLSEALQKIENTEFRRELRRELAEIMGLLDGKIGFKIRKASGLILPSED